MSKKIFTIAAVLVTLTLGGCDMATEVIRDIDRDFNTRDIKDGEIKVPVGKTIRLKAKGE